MKTNMSGKSRALIIGSVVVIAAIAAAVAFMFNSGSKESYRTVQVYEIDGSSQVDRPSLGILSPYLNMLLQNKDDVETFQQSYLQLKMDEDKYMLMEPNTQINLLAEGSAADSKTVIELKTGGISTHVSNKLSENSSYEINTPNCTMAVRGTVWRTDSYFDEQDVSHTIIEVCEGVIECHLVFPDGSIDPEGVLIHAGEKVRVWGNDKTSAYEFMRDGKVVFEEIDFWEMDIPVLEFLGVCIAERKADFTIPLPEGKSRIDEIIEIKKQTFTVSFMHGGSVFGTQSVQGGEFAKAPTLMPARSGGWNFDFDNTRIVSDTQISWG